MPMGPQLPTTTTTTTTATPRRPDDGRRVHVVRAGDTLWQLAATYATDVAALRARNPQLARIRDTDLPVGLHLDVGPAPPPAAAATSSGATAGATTTTTTTTTTSGSGSPTTSGAAPSPRTPADAATVQQSRQAALATDAAARARVGAAPGTKLEALVQRGETLREGSTGAEVVDLQRFLGLKTIEQDGAFGPRTTAALRTFQRQHGLVDDGVVGKDTLDALKKAGRAASDLTDLAQRMQTGHPVREGESGNHVRGLQRLLGLGPAGQTGVFGPTTRGAVEDAQRRLLGMTPTSPGWGTVGPLTYDALQRADDVRNASTSTAVAGAPSSHLRILAQRDATSCGLTSVAMVTNAWNRALGTGAPPITDRTLRAEMGAADLRRALTNHLPPGVTHYDRDWPRSARSFADIDAQLARGNPVIVGVGRPFTASGYGHIFVLGRKNADGSYEMFDPNGGARRNVTQTALANAGEHSEGSFYMVAHRR
jgi:peptidoglycan hydrolase-like protein with peptidoglycan-binding domain